MRRAAMILTLDGELVLRVDGLDIRHVQAVGGIDIPRVTVRLSILLRWLEEGDALSKS